MRKTWLLAMAVLSTFVLAAPAGAQAADASVVVVHGIPDTPVDVYVNDNLTLDDFASRRSPSRCRCRRAATPWPSGRPMPRPRPTPLLAATAKLAAGQNVPVVAHLDRGRRPDAHPVRQRHRRRRRPARAASSCATPPPPRRSTCSPAASRCSPT